MSERYQLIAYIATLATLALVFIAALATAAISPAVLGKVELFGLGTVTGGLIGVLRIPSAKQQPSGTPADPVNVTEQP